MLESKLVQYSTVQPSNRSEIIPGACFSRGRFAGSDEQMARLRVEKAHPTDNLHGRELWTFLGR
jgi:hypothetical protein